MRSQILPRRDTAAINSLLAGAVLVARFNPSRFICSDTGGQGLDYSRTNSGKLYEVAIRDVNSPGVLRFPRAGRKRSDLDSHEVNLVEFETTEAGLRNASLIELYSNIPNNLKEGLSAFEFLYLGKGFAQTRLYQRA